MAAVMSGLHVSKLRLTEMRVVLFGSGTAGIGIADQIRDFIAVETGNSKEEAVNKIWWRESSNCQLWELVALIIELQVCW